MIIYPNPVAGDRFWLYLWLDSTATVDAYIYAPTGEQKVSLQLDGTGPGWNEFPVDVREAVPGMYYLKVVARFSNGSPSRHFAIAKLVIARP